MRKDGSNFYPHVCSCDALRTTGFGLRLSSKACRYPRIVAYCLLLASLLALFNGAVQTVSSQTFDTPISTQNSAYTAQTTTTMNATELPLTSTEIVQTTTTSTSTATQFTRFTIAYATSSLYVTVYKIQYTTDNNLFTIVNVQFTTITTSVTQVQLVQPVGAPSLPVHSSTSSATLPVITDALLGHSDAGFMLQLIAGCLILITLLASKPLIRRERK